MPKRAASKAEVDAIRERIIGETIALINEAGFPGFSMRKLGSRLGIAAKTIYNYFSDKDELYLKVLSKGFALLHLRMCDAAAAHESPSEKLRAMARAYVGFGLENPHYYNVLFSLDLPRFQDYLGSRHAGLADVQNKDALKLAQSTRAAIDALPGPGLSETRANFMLMQLWSTLHGIVSLKNSRVTLEVGDLETHIDGMVNQAVDNLGRSAGQDIR